MRLRTGHGANDWTENEPGGYARLSGHSGGSIHGEIVKGGESEKDRQARYARESKARRKAVQA